jgi:hypothetical protein
VRIQAWLGAIGLRATAVLEYPLSPAHLRQPEESRMNRDRISGIAIILGSIAFIITMVFHPSGGDAARILRSASVILATHALAIASLPVSTFGFLGLTSRLGADRPLASAAMVFFVFGNFATMCAAVINGLALPTYVRNFADADPETLRTVQMIGSYGNALNAGFARVFMVAIAVAVLFWSLAILKTRVMPRWIGAVGTALGLILLGFAGALGVDVRSFGIFVFSYAAWAILVGILMCLRPRQESQEETI